MAVSRQIGAAKNTARKVTQRELSINGSSPKFPARGFQLEENRMCQSDCFCSSISDFMYNPKPNSMGSAMMIRSARSIQ